MSTLTKEDVEQFGAWTAELKGDIDNIIRDAIDHSPRSLQTRIGPSEIGHECDRWLLHKLNGDREPARAQVSWKPAIGTAVHNMFEGIFDAEDKRRAGAPFWLTEHRVTVGHLPDGTAITGSSDLFHVPSGTVIDWKIVGDKQLAHYRSHGPSQRYRVQAHSYGGGFMLDPHPWGAPKAVAIYFLPRDRAFEQGYFWSEPWNPAIWGDAINRLNRLWRELHQHGQQAIDSAPICDDQWCYWCQSVKREAGASARKNLFETVPLI